MPFTWAHVGGGAASGIGPIAEIGPGGAHAGRIVGLGPALKFIGAVGGPVATAALVARQKTRDFNDADAFPLEGASRGRPVGGGWGRPRGGPQPPRGGGPQKPGPYIGFPSGGPAPSRDEPTAEDYERAKQAGRRNRAYYRRTMGTPKRRPRNEEPFGPGDYGEPHPPKPMDTSNLRDWTP